MEKPVTLDAPLTSLPGIGPQRAALFARLNVRTVGELLRLYPRTYEDRTRLVSIASLEVGTPACFEAAVVTTPRTNRIPKPGSRMLEVTKFTVADDTLGDVYKRQDVFQCRALRRSAAHRRALLLLRRADRRLRRLWHDEPAV